VSARLLVIEHEAQCPAGWMGEWLEQDGVALDVRRPYLGETLPEHLDDHDGMLVLGGSMDADADADYPWLTATKELIRSAAEKAVPVLGICLGHQLIAVALGGACDRNPLGQLVGRVEVGWQVEAADDPLLGALTEAQDAVHWNDDVVTVLPPGAVVLARTARGELQAARFAPTVWGVQWHPEVHAGIVAGWAEHDRERARERGIDVDERVADIRASHDHLTAQWRGLADRLASVMSGAPAR
jgi:GMP synthase (glutamine-hydrolysing)